MKDNCFGLSNNPNEQPAASCGVSALDVEVCLKSVTPECSYRGIQFQTRLDSRLKHAGMTVFGKEISLTQRDAGFLYY